MDFLEFRFKFRFRSRGLGWSSGFLCRLLCSGLASVLASGPSTFSGIYWRRAADAVYRPQAKSPCHVGESRSGSRWAVARLPCGPSSCGLVRGWRGRLLMGCGSLWPPPRQMGFSHKGTGRARTGGIPAPKLLGGNFFFFTPWGRR